MWEEDWLKMNELWVNESKCECEKIEWWCDERVIELNNERSEMGWVWIMITKMMEISKVKKSDWWSRFIYKGENEKCDWSMLIECWWKREYDWCE